MFHYEFLITPAIFEAVNFFAQSNVWGGRKLSREGVLNYRKYSKVYTECIVGIFQTEGEILKQHRQLFQQFINIIEREGKKGQASSLEERAREEITILLDNIAQKHGQPFDILSEFKL